MPAGQIIGFTIAFLIGIVIGIFVYQKWGWPKRWFEFGLVLVYLVMQPFLGFNRGAHLFWGGGDFDIRAVPMGYGFAIVLAMAFLLRKFIDHRMANRQRA